MSLVIPDEIVKASRMSESELMLELIIVLFQKKKISIGKASRLAGMHLFQFQAELASRQITLHYGVEDFETDIKNLREMNRL